MNGENEILTNGLAISVDWLSWTFKDSSSVESVIEFMGFDASSFHLLPKGSSGYRSQLRHTGLPISVLYDGNEDMGVHVDVSGSAIVSLVQHYHDANMVNTPFGESAYFATSFDITVFSDMLKKILDRGQITRLDLAIDDIGTQFYSLDELHNIFEAKCYISKFRSWREIREHDNSQLKTGHTIYLGSRSSSIMLRIYDKYLEQMKKNTNVVNATSSWVRWELELKGERALSAAENLISGESLGSITVGILSHYLRIVEPDNCRLDRSSLSVKWSDFINGIASVSLYLPAKPKTLEDKRSWLLKQGANTDYGSLCRLW